MTQVSSYFASMGIEVDKRSFAEVDKYFDRLESKLQKIGKTSNAFAIPIKFKIDTAATRLSIQRDLNTISRGLNVKLNSFTLNHKALKNLLDQTTSTRSGLSRMKLNASLSSASLAGMRVQVQQALSNMVISPVINPRVRSGRGMGTAGAAYGPAGGYGGGRGKGGGWGLPIIPGPLLAGSAAAYAAMRAMKAVAGVGLGAQTQATRDVAARGIFEQATMPDGSTRNVYENSSQWFRAYTNRVGLDRNALTPSFQGFMAASMPTLGYESSRKVFEAFSSFGTVRGASGESMQRALVAVQQMASKGTVNAEELKQQLGDAQGFGEAQILFAQAYQMMKNKTNNPLDPRLLKGSNATAELGKAMKDNKLVASEILPIVSQLMLAKARPALDSASQTGQANQNRFNNARTAFLENFAKGGGDAGMSNIWKTLADLTERAARNAELMGANFRETTAYVRLFMVDISEAIDALQGNAKDDNVFKATFTPEMQEQIKLITEGLNLMINPIREMDFTLSNSSIKANLQEIISLIQASVAGANMMMGIVTLDSERFKAGAKGVAMGAAGVISPVAQQQLSGLFGVPSNTPAAANPNPISNYGYAPSKTQTNSVVVNNAVTITDASKLGTTVDQLSQKALADNMSAGLQFMTTMDKAAFPNSGQ